MIDKLIMRQLEGCKRMMDIAEKLRGACVGKPAVIQWPHRVLHEAAGEIERLREQNRLLAMEAS